MGLAAFRRAFAMENLSVWGLGAFYIGLLAFDFLRGFLFFSRQPGNPPPPPGLPCSAIGGWWGCQMLSVALPSLLAVVCVPEVADVYSSLSSSSSRGVQWRV